MDIKPEDPLFRSAALEHYLRGEEGGQPLRVSPPWTWMLWFVLLGASLCMLGFASCYHMPVSEQVEGKMRLSPGSRVLNSESEGVVTGTICDPGHPVSKGEVIVTLSQETLEAEGNSPRQLEITTPVNGLLDSRFVAPGDRVTPGSLVAIIRPQGQPLRVEASVPNNQTIYLGDGIEVGTIYHPPQGWLFLPAQVVRIGSRAGSARDEPWVVAELVGQVDPKWEEAARRPGAALKVRFTTRRSLLELITEHQKKR